jgi:hypothetical protein
MRIADGLLEGFAGVLGRCESGVWAVHDRLFGEAVGPHRHESPASRNLRAAYPEAFAFSGFKLTPAIEEAAEKAYAERDLP